MSGPIESPTIGVKPGDGVINAFPEDGSQLVFVIGPFRGGTTLLRKTLDSHSSLYSPAETWFLLPLLEMWQGRGTAEGFTPSQAAAALRQHLEEPQFLACCRAFAACFYGQNMPRPDMLFVDKTPLYLSIAHLLPAVFPAARFLVLSRDPRGLLWSRASWQHAATSDPTAHVDGVARDIRCLAAFLDQFPDRSLHVRYESLCETPDATLGDITRFLDLPYEDAMIDYGAQGHHEGYGDEKSRQHTRPHGDSVARWRQEAQFTDDLQRDLFGRCGHDVLARLDYDCRVEGASARVPAARSAGGDALIAFMHEGTNSRDHLHDFVRGFEQIGCDVARIELRAIQEPATTAPDPDRYQVDRVNGIIREHSAIGTLAMWANGFAGFPRARVDGTTRPLFDAMQVPHLAFWLDAPQWAYQGEFKRQFGSTMLNGAACRHLINNQGTATEMAAILGFSNVVAQPYGINPESFRPATGISPDLDLVFCLGKGAPAPSPSMLAALDSEAPDHEAIRHEVADDVRAMWRPILAREAVDLNTDQRDGICAVLDHLLRIQLASRGTPMPERLRAVLEADASLAQPVATMIERPALWVVMTETIRRVEQWERPFVFTYLARRFNCGVFSNPDLDGWGCPAQRLGWVDHDKQSATYARGRVALNVMRWQDDIGLNPKPMEITASGIACLCQHRVGLEDLYDLGTEMHGFTTASEAAEQLRDLLDDDTRRSAMAEAGLERTRRDHTWAVRAETLLPVLTGTPA